MRRSLTVSLTALAAAAITLPAVAGLGPAPGQPTPAVDAATPRSDAAPLATPTPVEDPAPDAATAPDLGRDEPRLDAALDEPPPPDSVDDHRVRPDDVAPMRLACELQRHTSAESDGDVAFDESTDRAVGVLCKWSEVHNDRFRGYQLWRTDGSQRTIVFASRNVEETHAVDRDLERATTYTYVVRALGPDGAVLAQSRPQQVRTPPGVRAVELACELGGAATTDRLDDARPDHQPGIACEWSALRDDRLAGWLLWRSDGQRRTLVFATRDTSITRAFDADIERETTYRYAILGVDKHGDVIARSRVQTVHVPPRPAPDPTPAPAEPGSTDVVHSG